MKNEEFIIQILEHWGLSVEKIPESEHPTPDFIATAENSSYLIELKTKSSNPEVVEQRESVLDAGEIFKEHTPMERRNRLSGIIHSATNQLRSFDAGEAIQLVWLHSIGHAADAQMQLFETAVYGSTTLVDWSENGISGDCYFFTNSDFFRYREDLDGAVISTPKEAKICLNPLSNNYEKFKRSFLCTTLDQGICDPYERERAGVAYIVDGDVDRNCKNAVLRYLRNKYQQEKLMDMTMNHMSVSLAYPHTD